VPNTLIEIWQCNAAGRYIHMVDQHPAPLDPNFTGAGRVVTDADGNYQFVTIKPACRAVPTRRCSSTRRCQRLSGVRPLASSGAFESLSFARGG
jgi:protocatechuate 3,4-dioxygenase beta subunit